jgi:hypothetical protein
MVPGWTSYRRGPTILVALATVAVALLAWFTLTVAAPPLKVGGLPVT